MKRLILSLAFAMVAGSALAQAAGGAGNYGAPSANVTGPREVTPAYTMGRYQAANEGGKALEPGNPLQQKAARELTAEAGVTCDQTTAGVVKDSIKGGKRTVSYEVACKDDFGWIVSKSGDTVNAYDCLALAASEKAAKGKLATCHLAANRGSLAGVATLASKAGLTCKPINATYLGGGGDPPISRYEVLCNGGSGYIIDAPQPRSKAPLQAMSCARAKATGAAVCALKP